MKCHASRLGGEIAQQDTALLVHTRANGERSKRRFVGRGQTDDNALSLPRQAPTSAFLGEPAAWAQRLGKRTSEHRSHSKSSPHGLAETHACLPDSSTIGRRHRCQRTKGNPSTTRRLIPLLCPALPFIGTAVFQRIASEARHRSCWPTQRMVSRLGLPLLDRRAMDSDTAEAVLLVVVVSSNTIDYLATWAGHLGVPLLAVVARKRSRCRILR